LPPLISGINLRLTSFIAFVILGFALLNPVAKAQTPAESFMQVLEQNTKLIQRSSVKTVQPVLNQIQETGFEGASQFLQKWQDKELWYRRSDDRFFYVSTEDNKTYQLIDIVTGNIEGTVEKKEIRQVRANSGVRGLLAASLVQFQLNDPDLRVRRSSLQSIERNSKPEHLEALRIAIEKETNQQFAQRLKRLERLLTVQFETNEAERIAALRSFEGDLKLDVRASLNPILNSRLSVAKAIPENENIARIIRPGKTYVAADGSAGRLTFLSWFSGTSPELDAPQAYSMLVRAGFAPEDISDEEFKATLVENIRDNKVGNYNVSQLNSDENRMAAYQNLVLLGVAKPIPTAQEKQELVNSHVFYAAFNEPNANITDVTREVLSSINTRVKLSEFVDLTLDAISLASIYFLAAIGLAITFGVMRVINMAHGEFIMMGAYSGYVVQQVITNYTLSIIIAIPVAFMVTFLAGVLMERTIIRHLYHRPLETLLATFGVSIALQQIAKNIFGTQARPLTSPEWLDGAWVFNDVVSISLIRIAILVLSILFFCGLLWTLNKTRLGLETRAVTQNPRMAASMGIDPDKINMLTFGLGSGIAGVAGVAIGLYAKVTSEMGGDYIVQSFMTVVVGGVGSVWGTLAGATMIGFLQKFIEYFNPSNTLAAQTYMIIFIIIFIQFRPRGLIALKGRAAEA